MNVNERLDRIEAKLKPTSVGRVVWWIHFVSPGHLDRSIRRIRRGDQEWLRADGETDEAFRQRAESEAAIQTGQSALIMLMD